MIAAKLAAYGWVALGSALGGMSRYWLGGVIARGIGDDFPYGTLLINVVGSFVIGFFGTLTLPDGPRPASLDARLFVMVGLCGGFTTFSSFSLQTFELLRSGEGIRAAIYVAASVLLCVAGAAIGHALASAIAARS
jgi:fluoride exporter